MECIDDPTRVCRDYQFKTYANVAQFVESELDLFLKGYVRHKLEGQSRHVELLLEKNTLMPMCEPVADRFMLPLTVSRGYGNASLWSKVEERFRQSGAEELILLTVADHDPDGFALIDDAVRSLRDLHSIPVKVVRVGLTMEQIQGQGAHPNFAKESSSRFKQYVQRTGSNECWEVEALDPKVLQTELHDAILSVLDMEQLQAVQDQQAVEQKEIAQLRQRVRTGIVGIINGGNGGHQ